MSVGLPPLFEGLCDDAAVFPPGNLPLAEAVPAHARHEASAHRSLVGPFVMAAKDLDELDTLLAGRVQGVLGLSLTVPLRQLAAALVRVEEIPPARLEALEVALPDDRAAGEVVPGLVRALDGRAVPVFVELPRDARRPDIVKALSGTGFLAKLRTGGVRADLYPDEEELAAAVAALTSAGVPFKSTAGLHHAVRNTDPETGFEQHGFLNLLAAAGAALDDADASELTEVLADRDGARVADRVRALTPVVRDVFRSFGTCSIAEPVEDLAGLGLVDFDLVEDLW